MGLNVFERTALKLAWKRMEGKFPVIKKWLPLIGSALVLSTIVLRALGHQGPADAIDSLAKALGLTDASVVDPTIVTGAVAGLVGIALKLYAEFKKARA